MKSEKNSGTTVKISFLISLTLMTILMVSLSFCGRTGTPDEAKDIPFVQVEEMPMYTGGNDSLLNFIATHTTYPEEAKEKGISGKVIVRFVVEKDCSVSHVEVLKGVDPLLDAEAVRVVASLPKFEKPAKNEGKVVSVFYMVPISFALN